MTLLMPADHEWIVRDWTAEQWAAQGWDPYPHFDSRLTEAKVQVVIIDVGGAERTIVSSDTRLVFDCYAPTEAQARRCAARMFALVRDLDCRVVNGVQFYEIEPTTPQNYPDPRKPDLYRYQFNAVIHARYVGAH